MNSPEQESRLQLCPWFYHGEIGTSESETEKGEDLLTPRSSWNETESIYGSPLLVSGVTLMQFMVQNIIGYPWASPLGSLGGLDPTMGHGSPDRPWDCRGRGMSLQAWRIALIISQCRCFAGCTSCPGAALLPGNMPGYFIDLVNKKGEGKFLHRAKDSFLPPCCLDLCHCLNLSRFAIPTSAVWLFDYCLALGQTTAEYTSLWFTAWAVIIMALF